MTTAVGAGTPDSMASGGRVPVLTVDDLDVTYHVQAGALPALRGISFELRQGEILGVVGESGCGKSTLSAALLRLLAANGEISGGRILLGERDLARVSDRELRQIRGQEIAMIFQDPLTSLNPTFRVGTQLVAAQRAHRSGKVDQSTAALRRRAIEMLTTVGLPDARERIDYYPHQFSGGMRQRIMIAMALLLRPEVLIADEATSALDVTLQAQILELFRDLRREQDTSMLFISHDIGVISELCDRMIVMYAGRAVEQGTVHDVLTDPKHPYTQALLDSVPSKDRRGQRLATIPGRVPSLSELPPGCEFADRCPHAQSVCREPGVPDTQLADRVVRCLIHEPTSDYDRAALTANAPRAPAPNTDPADQPRETGEVLVRASGLKVHFADRGTIVDRLRRKPLGAVRAVDGVDLEIRRGEIVGLVGESGSGKTTLGRTLLGLERPTGGTITYDGQDLTGMGTKGLRSLRRRMQMIFQDAHASLSPRRRVGQLLAEPYLIHGIPERDRIPVPELLEMVQLDPAQATKFPHELSGGQARRVNIARALALRPEFIVADEPSAGLDVSAAASVLNLMKDLAGELGLTYLIVSHDMNLIGYIADRIALMYLGTIVESGLTPQVFEAPAHPYTQSLLDVVPVPDPDQAASKHRLLLPGEIPSPKSPPPGCRFHTRCRFARPDPCLDVPVLERVESGQFAACHLWKEIRDDPETAAANASPELMTQPRDSSG